MNVNSFGTRVQQIIVMVLVVILVTLVVFYGYLPDNYNYKVGSVAESDVYATRTLTDTYQTEYEAMIAKNNVAAIFVRDERLSASNVDNVETFFNNVAQTRNLMNSGDAGAFITENIAVQNLNSTLKSALNKKFD